MSVLLFHPMVAPHVQQAALALYEAGQLAKFVTSVRDNPQGIPQRILALTGRVMGVDFPREFRRRRVSEIPLELVESLPWGELSRLVVGKLDRDQRLTDLVWERSEKYFARAVARKVHRPLTGIYGFEHGALEPFQRAEKLGIARGYEVPAPESTFTRAILDRELQDFPELRTSYQTHLAKHAPRRTARLRDEWELATVIVAASRFTRDSYAFAGYDVAKVRVLPLGAPPPVDLEIAQSGGSQSRGPLKLLWVGAFSGRKGAHQLLRAWRAAPWQDAVQLDVFGSQALPSTMVDPIPRGIHFHGSIPRSELTRHYIAADALIFPTLCDGFGMVVTEAWAHGVPVITTPQAGAADFLRPGENGLKMAAGNPDEISQAVSWCLQHREALQAMRAAARATAANWQWSDYRAALASALGDAGLFN